MKALTIKNPFAELIIQKHKEYEFRTWKTNYRGKVLIHTSQKPDQKRLKEFEHLNLKYKNGYIIGEAYIKDCIKIDNTFKTKLLKKDKIVYKNIKENEYAFKLEKVKQYKTPIKTKGKLGLWNYDENFIMKEMDNINYGWVDKENKYHTIDYDTFSDNYKLQSPEELIKSKLGVCWDQVELERYYFKKLQYKINSYFICHYDNNNCPSHTFLIYEKNNKYYWFEHSWEKYKGIHEYKTKEELLKDVKEKFIKTELNNTYNKNNLLLREYQKPKYNISVIDFYKHCEQNKIINI